MPSGAAELVTQRPGRFSALVGNDEATKLDGFLAFEAAASDRRAFGFGDANRSIHLDAASIEDGGSEILASPNRQEPIP